MNTEKDDSTEKRLPRRPGYEIIAMLLKNIDWLGGDAYEMEAIADDVQEARDWLDKKGKLVEA